MKDHRDAQSFASSTDAIKARADDPEAAFWWGTDDEDLRAKRLTNLCKSLEQVNQERHQANLRYARMYENVELDSLTGGDYATAIVRQALIGRGIVRLNVVAACEDTLAAKIAKNKPRPLFLTSGGSWTKQQKTRKLNHFGIGLFYEMKAYEKAKDIFYDAMTYGTGMLHVFQNADTGRLACERALPDEMFIDEADGYYGEPRQLIRRKWIQREVLVAMFPEKAQEIYDSSPPRQVRFSNKEARTPIIEVWEAWHLPSKPGDGNGAHCICIDGHELFHEEWKLDCFPFVTFRFKKRTVGFWGKGVAETLTGIQIELNRLMNSVSEQLRRKGRGRIFLQKGGSVNPAHLTNGIADIVYYTGQAPIVDNQNAVSQEEFAQIDRLYQRAFQEVGVSELSAAAKKPSGLDAAVALREFSDIESERFALVHQAWELFFMDLMELCLEMIRKQVGTKGYEVRLPNKRLVIDVDWKDIGLEANEYVMQMFPVSSLPQTPAARYQKVTEMMQDGFIDKPVAMRLLDYPDLEAEQNLGNAAIDDVDATISAILDEAEPRLMPLDPFQNLQLLTQRALAAYLFARHNGAEENRLDMLRQLIEDATAAQAAATAPPPMPPPPPGGSPPPPGPGGPAGMRIGSNVGNLNVNAAPPVAPAVPPTVAQ